MKSAIILAVALILISGCESNPVVPPLELPPPLEVPVVKAEELECLANETYDKLLEQNRLRKEREVTLENIIKSTWKK